MSKAIPAELLKPLDAHQSSLAPFDFQLPTRVVFGNGCVARIAELASTLEAQRILVVSDPGIVEAGLVHPALKSLTDAGATTKLFDGTCENPTTAEVARGVEVANEFRPDLIIGFGGGSSMDCAKGINFIYSCGGEMKDYWGVDKATGPMLPMIAVPTTGGTGSEMQAFALISDEKTHVKMACGDTRARCKIAILDPQLTLTQPPLVTALSGIDAISHAVETYVTQARNPSSLVFSRESWRLLAASFATVLSDPDNIEARGAMQLGASYSGLAIQTSMLGASHALSNPLTATYGIAHGQAVGAILPHVVRYNGQHYDELYQEMLQVSTGRGNCPPPESGSQGLAEFIQSLLQKAGLATDLRSCGVQREQLGSLSEAAALQWTGQFNPRPVGVEALREIYEQAY